MPSKHNSKAGKAKEGLDPKVRAIEDVAFDMGIDESTAYALFETRRAHLRKDYRGREAVEMSLVKDIAATTEYLSARDTALATGRKYGRPANTPAARGDFRAESAARIQKYWPYIGEIAAIHRRHLESANRDGFESSIMAQYLLLSRAIALLRALLDALSQGHYYALSLMRDIDECLDLAHYFLVAGISDEGRHNLLKWFREGQWPSHRACRRAIAGHMADAAGLTAESQEALHAELYRKKSRFTHPSFLAIRDLTLFEKNRIGEIRIADVGYGDGDEEERMLQAVEFFEDGALLPVALRLCMCLCAAIGIESADKDRLLAIVRELGG